MGGRLLAELAARRARLLERLAAVDDFRRAHQRELAALWQVGLLPVR